MIADGRRRPGRRRAPRSSTRTGLVALPGLVDLHTHLREPGREDAETVEPGSRAAALGGYTAVCAMANTSPVADTAGVVEQVWRLGREAGLVDVQPIGAVTVGLAGERWPSSARWPTRRPGCGSSPTTGTASADPRLMRRALEYVKAFDGVIAQHAEEPRLTAGAQMHEGERLGPARPARLAGGRRGGDHRPGRAAGRARRRAAAHLPRLHRRQRRDPPLGQAPGHPGHRRGDPAPPAAHRRAGARATTRCSRSTRRCARPPTWPRCGPAWSTA